MTAVRLDAGEFCYVSCGDPGNSLVLARHL